MTSLSCRAGAVAGLLAATTLCAAEAPREQVRGQLEGRNDRFIELRGSDAKERFVAVSADRRLAFGDSGIEILLTQSAMAKSGGGANLRYEFLKASAVRPVASLESKTRYNWFVGAQENWRTDLRSFGEIAYRQPWAGVDAVYSGDKSGIKYHFAVGAGVDPKTIAFLVSGADEARINADGDVEWQVAGKRVVDQRPVSFQSQGGRDAVVPTQFTLEKLGEGRWRLGFDVRGHDAGKELVIDPALVAYSGLIGGNAGDQVYGITRDNSGNTYACGNTASSDLVTIPNVAGPAGDNAFFAKFGPTGTPLVVTYLGGGNYDACHAIALGTTGNIFLAGTTKSTNFPFVGADPANRLRRSKATTDRDAFVTAFNAAGSAIVYSGVMGGTDDDQANAIAVDSSDRAYITGYSQCLGTPVACTTAFNPVAGPVLTHKGGLDGFVARINAAGNGVDYSGFLGGDGTADSGNGIAVDGSNNAFVVGETNSATGLPAAGAPFRSTPGTRPGDPSDGFIARIDGNGALSAFTVLTGTQVSSTGVDRAFAVAINNDGTLIVGGETDSANFPANNAGTRLGTGPQNALAGSMDGFVVRISADLSTVLAATYIGGNGYDAVEGVATDGKGSIFIAGTTSSTAGFPTVAGLGVITAPPAQQNGFIARMQVGAPSVFQYSGYVGGNGNDALHAVAANSTSVAFVGGGTTSPTGNFINPNTAALSAGAGSVNGLVVRLDPGFGAADFNSDGKPDLIWHNTTSGATFIWRMNGTTFASDQLLATIDPSWTIVGTGDFDGDGKTDVVWRNTASGATFVWYLNDGVLVTDQLLFNLPPIWKVEAVADFNGDGRPDFLVRNTTTGVGVLIFMNNATLTGTQDLFSVDPSWKIEGAADFDLDGRPDLLFRNTATGLAFVWNTTYAGGVASLAASSPAIFSIDPAWEVVQLTDWNADARPDFLFRNKDTGVVFVWFATGTTLGASAFLFQLPTVWEIVPHR